MRNVNAASNVLGVCHIRWLLLLLALALLLLLLQPSTGNKAHLCTNQ
jgi:hypothetical protein